MRDALTIARRMFRDAMGGWVSLLFVVGIVALCVVLLRSSPHELHDLVVRNREIGLQVTLWTTVLLVVIVGSTALPREIETGTIFFLLTKPISRFHVILGKLAGLLGVTYSFILLQTIISVAVAVIRAGVAPDWNFVLGTMLLTGRVTILASAAIMFSSVLSEFPTIFFSAAYLAVGTMICLVDTLIMYGSFDWEIRLFLRIVYYSVPNFNLFVPSMLANATGSWGFVVGAAGYTVCYAAMLTWLALWAFSRREFHRA